ncbi:MAG: hypothetical protein JWQ97_26 [Phenylobacterium sp.]|nr:hypothetical protein [Phenylobacterium sp.]
MTAAAPPTLRIATAGWTIPRAVAAAFPADGSALQRYAARFDASEINSTFHRSHRPQTYARWAESVPDSFRFAVKLPRTLTHDARLADPGAQLDAFMAEAGLLGDRLGALLVQLPPSLAFDETVARAFFAALRARWTGAAACEPRHASWFEADAEALLTAFEVARVAADPARHPLAGQPGGWGGLAYWRLHGSPRTYYSSYGEAELGRLAQALARSPASETWCVFDNTASGAAAADALALAAVLARA